MSFRRYFLLLPVLHILHVQLLFKWWTQNVQNRQQKRRTSIVCSSCHKSSMKLLWQNFFSVLSMLVFHCSISQKCTYCKSFHFRETSNSVQGHLMFADILFSKCHVWHSITKYNQLLSCDFVFSKTRKLRKLVKQSSHNFYKMYGNPPVIPFPGHAIND